MGKLTKRKKEDKWMDFYNGKYIALLRKLSSRDKQLLLTLNLEQKNIFEERLKFLMKKRGIDKALPQESRYYLLWKHILDKRIKPEWSILDVGCGYGQFAKMAVESGHHYVGLDYNLKALNRARELAPKAEFHLVDIDLDRSLIEAGNYDVITFIEFLEHIKKDKRVLRSIPEGRNIVFSLPNFKSKNHYRSFKDSRKIIKRYGNLIEFKGQISEIRFPPSFKQILKEIFTIIYIASGVRRPN